MIGPASRACVRWSTPAVVTLTALLAACSAGVQGGTGGATGAGGNQATDGPPSSDTSADQVSCAFRAYTAARVPLDLALLVDASGSMANPVTDGGQTKWQLAREALSRFVRDPGSAGLGLGLQFFPLLGEGSPCNAPADCSSVGSPPAWLCQPQSVCFTEGNALDRAPWCSVPDGVSCIGGQCQPLGTCAMSGQGCANVGAACAGGVVGDTCMQQPRTCQQAAIVCEADRYQQLAVAVADLPAAAVPLIRMLSMRRPGGATPMAEATIGTLTNLRNRLAAMAGRHAAMIIATDGLPGGCSNQDIPSIADTLYTANQSTPQVSTYIIGVLDAQDRVYAEDALGQLARAGGTSKPIILDPAQDLTQKLVTALDAIRNDALPCEYGIPADPGNAIDYDNVNLHFQGATADENIPFVRTAAQCDATRGGWYYNVDPNTGTPQRVMVCPATCTRLKAEPSGKVDLRFGCKTILIE